MRAWNLHSLTPGTYRERVAALSETAYLITMLFPEGVPKSSGASPVCAVILDYLCQIAWLDWYARDPSFYVYILTIASFLTMMKHDAKSWITLLDRFPHRERLLDLPAHREMELVHLRSRIEPGRKNQDLPKLRKLYRKTIVAKRRSPVSYTDNELYALTHTTFYVSDFGRRSSELVIGAEECAYLCWSIKVLLACTIRRDKPDILGELLACCCFIGASVPRLTSIAIRTMLRAGLHEGCAEHSNRRHELLVWAMALEALLRRSRAK